MGLHATGSAVTNHISSEMARELIAIYPTVYHLWSLVYRTVSVQRPDSVFVVNRYTENPVPERSGSASGELQGDPLHETTEIENKNENGKSEEKQQIYRMNCLIGNRNSGRMWLMKVLQQSLGETQSREAKTLQVTS